MAEPGVGFEFPARKVSWLKRDVLLFNLSIGCRADEPQFVYVSETHEDGILGSFYYLGILQIIMNPVVLTNV